MKTNKLLFGNGLVSTIGRDLHVNSARFMLIIQHGAGEQHRWQRKLLNSVFSPRHLAEMIPAFYEVTSKVEAQMFHQCMDLIVSTSCVTASLKKFVTVHKILTCSNGQPKDVSNILGTYWTKWLRCVLTILSCARLLETWSWRFELLLGHSFDDLGLESRPSEYTYALRNLTFVFFNWFCPP